MSRQLSLDNQGFINELLERGSAEIEHGISSDEIDNLINSYTSFTTRYPNPAPSTMDAMLPDGNDPEVLEKQLDDLDRSQDRESEWHKYRTNIPWVAKPMGFTDRSFQVSALARARGVRLDDDPKEYYHYAPAAQELREQIHKDNDLGAMPQEVYMLERAFFRIHNASRLMTEKALSAIEDLHPQIRTIITPKSIAESPVRLLFYHPDQSPNLGAGHYDKSAITFQIAESHEGLRLAKDKDSTLEMVRRKADKAVVFPSDALREEIPDTLLTPGWHDIIESDQLNSGRNLPPKAIEVCSRWAIIFFANRAEFVQPDKARMHQR